MGKNYLVSSEIAQEVIGVGIKKASLSVINMILLGILGGAFIAFAAEASNMAIHRLSWEDYGLGKALAGVIFTTGLMLVAVAGAELFTGNTLMIIALIEKKITVWRMLRNWIAVYIGNLIGASFIAFMMNYSGLFNSSNGLMGGFTIKTAAYKATLDFPQALILGILCNWLVCLAMWMAYGAKDISGKLLAIYFPISLFITSGFEHSVANMYYIPAGILAKSNAVWAGASGLSPEKLAHLNWEAFFIHNLIPVTLGNIVGGGVLVAGVYWFVYIRLSKEK
ncbi:MAG: formate/nitrite transporter family protein [Clostridia bacterium]|nr:formate/nitrite transporter family protein [Clostridia bacterium]